MSAPGAISVVVPFFNSERYLERCIESLLDQNFSAPYEVILVDNGSSDGSAAIAQRFRAQVRLCKQLKPGAYAARNAGIQQAQYPLIAFTDADCVAEKNWLGCIAQRMTDPEISMVVGRNQYPPNASLFLHLLGGYENAKTDYVISCCDPKHHYGYTNNMAIRASVFKELGLFREWQRAGDSELVHRLATTQPDQRIAYDVSMRVTHMEFVSVWKRLNRLALYSQTNAKIETFEELRFSQRLGVLLRWLRR